MSFLSFVGGAAKQYVTSTEQAEQDAKEMAKLSFNGLYKRYEENAESNRELTNKMKAEETYIKTMWKDATPEQINELVANPVALDAIKKTKNPSAVDLNNYIRVIKGNESKAAGAERAASLGPLVEKVKAAMQPAEPAGGSPLGAFYRDVGKKRTESDMEKYAKAQGLTLKEMQQSAKVTRPAGSAAFDMGVLQEAPDSVEDMVKTANVARVQAKQKFGENSEQYKKADETYTSLNKEIEKADKSPEARVDRLMIERQDKKNDPAAVKALTTEINNLNKDILAQKKATSTGEGDTGLTYTKARLRMEDFMNTDMITNKGLGWRKYEEVKQLKDEATGKMIEVRSKNAKLTPEQEQEYITGMRNARMQGLRELGLVTADGVPVNNEVRDLMTSYGLRGSLAAATPAPVQTNQQVNQPQNSTAPVKPSAPAAAPQLPAPQTKAEYDALPPGTRYIDIDGKTKDKS